MANDTDVLLLLGRIEGKLDQVIETAEEHRDDDKRRFTEVYEKLDEHSNDINQAKGAKGALLWVSGIVAAVVSAAAGIAAKVFGTH
mgnify:CR=1 FL=1